MENCDIQRVSLEVGEPLLGEAQQCEAPRRRPCPQGRHQGPAGVQELVHLRDRHFGLRGNAGQI